MSKRLRYALSVLTLLFILAMTLGRFVYQDIPVNTLKEQYANEESEFMLINGMNIHYRDEGSGTPILLIHGTAASLHTWNDWTDKLKQNYRILRLDLPAFGLTDPNPEGDYSVETYVNIVETFLSRLEIDSLHIAGNSLGGNIAWNFAANNQNKIKTLTLLNSSGYMSNKDRPWVLKLAATPVVNHVLKFITPRLLVEKNLREVYYDDSKISEALVSRYHQMILREGNRQAFIDRAKIETQDNTDMLRLIHNPTLVIWGQHDEWIPVEHANKFLADLPEARLEIIPDVGHIPMEELPNESVEIFENFLLESSSNRQLQY